ncbi:cytoplasmic protein [Geoanaerobacter pelophilus]|uniref:Cytoplasmic protein n=1 Tax=Geoanaerobacter pelophilus TaxID=60036 RepID=A0ABQ0MGI1_9BACT|nr:DUF2703 domain-containing protein [Geoanaerobacter pelophilus]GAW66167.1 cytoplasmic protein [Geoanaerobacter pelophilus]
MPELRIKWQRLVDDTGQTCSRCSGTGDEVATAVGMLSDALAHLGITVAAEMTELRTNDFLQDPLESNRVWIGGKPLECWLHAEIGKSDCCGPCGESQCRTLSVGGQGYEVIPKKLILKAGLLAAAEMVGS